MMAEQHGMFQVRERGNMLICNSLKLICNNKILSTYTNIITNGNFLGIYGWGSQGASYSVSNNVATIVTATTSNSGIHTSPSNYMLTVNKKYYASGIISSSSNKTKFQISNNETYASEKYHTGSGNYEKLSCIYQYSNNYNSGSVNIFHDTLTGGTPIIYAKNIIFVCLTDIFGLGAEPSLDWCDVNLPFIS
jgi:hypothetical protein